MKLLTGLATLHDWPLLGLAGLVCAAGAWVTIGLYRIAGGAAGRTRWGWTGLAGIAAGSTVWCTHFAATLGYRPSAAVVSVPAFIALSLLLAVASSAVAIGVGSLRRRFAPEAGGALFGVGAAATQVLGIGVFSVEGLKAWDGLHVAVTILLSLMFGASAFRRAARADGRSVARSGTRRAAALLALSVLAVHGVGMAGLAVVPGVAAVGASTGGDASAVLALAVAAVGLTVLAAGATAWLLDAEARHQTGARLRHLANGSVDGVVIEQDGRVIDVNAAFADLVGRDPSDLRDRTPVQLGLPDLAQAGQDLIRTALTRPDGTTVPVEVVARREPVRAGEPAVAVYAVRDLQPRLEQERRLADLARRDPLTGLPNRQAFLERLDRALAERSPDRAVALFAIDLDRFKEINDLHGHKAGDVVLKTLSGRLAGVLRSGEFLARLGADEFAALAEVGNRDAALAAAERLCAPLFDGVEVDDAEIVCGASIGVALYPEDADGPTALMNNADLAMYRAKGSIADRICFYEEAMDEAVRERRKTIQELREALRRNQFELRFQVQHAVSSGEITGYETLLRWKNPERGYVPPMEFIPLAEETGLILPIGEWVLRNACAAAAGWPKPFKVAVNLSAVQLGSADLPRLVHQVLIDTGLPPHRLELEITETALILDPKRTTHVLRQLKALGVSVAMDDFGTGYSSLSTLRAFPFDKIKLDKSFVSELEQSPQARAIIKAVLALGDSLSIPILAEGVETADQLAFLKALGCDEAQGYHLGRPAPTIDGEPAEDARAA